jgi:hypothetical protein
VSSFLVATHSLLVCVGGASSLATTLFPTGISLTATLSPMGHHSLYNRV